MLGVADVVAAAAAAAAVVGQRMQLSVEHESGPSSLLLHHHHQPLSTYRLALVWHLLDECFAFCEIASLPIGLLYAVLVTLPLALALR
uniref:Putative secreted peptide n=1 Tax=Anopheles braziliensis TaxID=58242 RepID=A0A2M3ZPI5_9DIPT